MIKWLLTIAIIVLALMLWFGKGRRGGASSTPKRRKESGPQPMVTCAHCGLHLPQPEATEGEGGRHYCSAEHRRLGPGPSR